jgi:hypothetical protein
MQTLLICPIIRTSYSSLEISMSTQQYVLPDPDAFWTYLQSRPWFSGWIDSQPPDANFLEMFRSIRNHFLVGVPITELTLVSAWILASQLYGKHPYICVPILGAECPLLEPYLSHFEDTNPGSLRFIERAGLIYKGMIVAWKLNTEAIFHPK